MNFEETAHWVSGLFPGEMMVGELGPCRVATFANPPENIACTLNFGQVDTGLTAEGMDVRSELFTVATQAEAAPILVAAAYQMLVDAAGRILARPGELLPGLATLALQHDLTAKHGVLTVPYVWGGDVPHFREPGKQTLMLQVIFLTDDEFVYLNTYGLPALQQEISKNSINIHDLRR
ncbi:suppressor of fused domain protein [Corynebacterium epidermidicanis]|uniref:Suppressor of fused protein (SUFU) n=1 Tax=Corynebacterium epidermidicanis TaxID=1050174 RepID=A0A0G3GRG4_9CORY|nr:suppressor of fused domain protein [Corynebacterium epidermidicanis]AKK02123.1 Suppressor of fused protein (SUFU) [Corynebacterium epidermidicanis]